MLPKTIIPAKAIKGVFPQWEPVWDSVPINNGAFPRSNIFFTQPIGAGTTPKTLSDTSLTSAGQLTAGFVFNIWYISFHVTGLTNLGHNISIYQIFNSRAVLEFERDRRTVYQIPLGKIPVNFGPRFDQVKQTVAADAFFAVDNGLKGAPYGYRIQSPIKLLPNQQFNAKLIFEDSLTIAGAQGNSKIFLDMDGLLNLPAD